MGFVMPARNKISKPYRDRIPCPICGNPLYCDRWYDDVWGAPLLVETVEECKPCGYMIHYSYGSTSLEIGRRTFGFYHDAPQKAKDRAFRRFDRYVATARRHHKKRWKKAKL